MDQSARKRANSGTISAKRTPLAETSWNIPKLSAKKQKTKSFVTPRTSLRLEQPKDNIEGQLDTGSGLKTSNYEEKTVATNVTVTTAAKSARLVGDELKSWQASWRKIMRESVVYFDAQGSDLNNPTQQQEQKKALRALKSVGCDIVPFYDREVTIIVSRRSFSAGRTYPFNDIFHDAVAAKTKVWDFDKVFRFLKNLGVSESATQDRTGNLSHLLEEEKIYGSTDRDPDARRDDLHYLEKNFIYVYDLAQAVRPIIVREWPSSSYPSFFLTLDGKCPFINDASENSQRKKLRRLQKFEATKEYRELLKKVSISFVPAKDSTYLMSSAFNGTSTSTDICEVEGQDSENRRSSQANDMIIEGVEGAQGTEKNVSAVDVVGDLTKIPFFRIPSTLSRNSSTIQPFQKDASNSKFYDVAASGYNGASNAIQFSMDSALSSMVMQNTPQGNGLGPTISQVPSRNLNNFKRRIFMKRQMHKADESRREAESRPGYCENCRVKYDHFDDHIASNRHRNFARDDKNFEDIDDLIRVLNESKSMGFVSSNGDYNFSD